MVNERRLGIVRVDGELLRLALRLPKGTEILDVRADFVCPGAFEIKLSHVDLLPVAEGNVILRYNPVFDSDGFVAWGKF